MKLHQLRYLAAVAQSGLNITAAAQKLHTSQPGVSKQIKLLEDELGFQIFVRDGRNLTRVTPAGQQVIDRAIKILREVQNIKRLSDDLKDEERGSLSIATTHTQARYVLPEVIKQFREKYPEVRLHLHQGTSEQIAEMAALGIFDARAFRGGVKVVLLLFERRLAGALDRRRAGEFDDPPIARLVIDHRDGRSGLRMGHHRRAENGRGDRGRNFRHQPS